jgi:hypothetical protein
MLACLLAIHAPSMLLPDASSLDLQRQSTEWIVLRLHNRTYNKCHNESFFLVVRIFNGDTFGFALVTST